MTLFSVIIPSYNRAALIGRTIDSVLEQQFTDYEVIVVDDGSTDNTLEVLGRYGSRVRLFRQENRGPGAARSLGISHASGQYIAFLDSDDLWFPWTLATYQKVIEQYDSPTWMSGNAIEFAVESELPARKAASLKAELFADYLTASRINTWLPPGAIAVKTQAIRDCGSFTDRRINAEDTDLWMRLGTASGFVLIASPLLYGYRKHAGGVSRVSERSIEGIRFLLEQERSGHYPGGVSRAAERHRILSRHLRALSLRCLADGNRAAGWELYRESWTWQLRDRRLKYLLGFPLYAALQLVHPRR